MPRIAIVTQDPANRGGVLQLVKYLYGRIHATGSSCEVLHYASNRFHPELNRTVFNVLKDRSFQRPAERRYVFEGLQSRAIGTVLPEFEPQRLGSNALWATALAEFDRFWLVTGSAHTGLPLVEEGVPFSAWVSSTVEDDRRERLASNYSPAALLEKATLGAVRGAELRVLQRAASLLAVSEDTANRLDRLLGMNRAAVWPYPVDTNFFNPGNSRRESRVVFVGRANDPRKRFGLFRDAMRHVRTTCTIDVVSSVSPEGDALPNEIHFESVSAEKLREMYQRAKLMVISSEQEGLGIAGMEAMACGLPVVSTDCGGTRMFVRDGETGYITSDDPLEISKRVEALLADDALHTTMSHSARDIIESEFSRRIWDTRFDQLILA